MYEMEQAFDVNVFEHLDLFVPPTPYRLSFKSEENNVWGYIQKPCVESMQPSHLFKWGQFNNAGVGDTNQKLQGHPEKKKVRNNSNDILFRCLNSWIGY